MQSKFNKQLRLCLNSKCRFTVQTLYRKSSVVTLREQSVRASRIYCVSSQRLLTSIPICNTLKPNLHFMLRKMQVFKHPHIECVPLATEPGISLIILTQMKILQRNLSRGTFVVWDMKRNMSVVCVCSAPNCCDTEQRSACQPACFLPDAPLCWSLCHLAEGAYTVRLLLVSVSLCVSPLQISLQYPH
jgi:hypothetical protein